MENMMIRRMDFAFQSDMDLVFIKDDPDMSFMFLGAWMMLPYLEPFLIRLAPRSAALSRIGD